MCDVMYLTLYYIIIVVLGAVHNCQHLNGCTKHTLSQTPFPLKKCTPQHFSILKLYEIKFFFHCPPPHHVKEYVLYTPFNVDNYGWPLNNDDSD